MVITDFQVKNKASKPRFFQEIFLVANIKFEVILRIFYLKISNADISFGERTLMRKFYTINKALSTIKQVQIVNPKEFVIVVLDVNSKMLMIYMAIQKREKMLMHSKKQAQIRALLFDQVSTKILAEYSDYSNVFLAENATKLP